MPARILITRSAHQASELAECLRALGAQPILIPTIEFAESTTFDPLDTALAQLDTFHWLLFTSANAVEVFAKRAGNTRSPKSKIAAIGPATAKAIEAIGLHAELVPTQAVAESLAEALIPYAHQPDGKPTRFLLVRAEQARDHLPDTLRASGANVTIAPAYRTVIPASSIPAIRGLFRTPASYPDAITFTSSSTAINLLALFEAAELELPPEIVRVSIGPITSQTLRELGFPPNAEAAEPTIPALVEILTKILNLKKLL